MNIVAGVTPRGKMRAKEKAISLKLLKKKLTVMRILKTKPTMIFTQIPLTNTFGHYTQTNFVTNEINYFYFTKFLRRLGLRNRLEHMSCFI